MKITTISPSDIHRGTTNSSQCDVVKVLEQELDADPRDNDERAIYQGWVALHDDEQLPDDHAHRDDAEDPAGDDDPQFVRHRHCDKDRVHGKHDIGEFHFDDSRPEGRHPEPGTGWLDRATLLRILVAKEVLIRQIQQVKRAQQLHPHDLDHVGRKNDSCNAEDKSAHNSVAQRLLLLTSRQPQYEHREHHCVVSTEDRLERHEQPDGDQVSSLNVPKHLAVKYM